MILFRSLKLGVGLLEVMAALAIVSLALVASFKTQMSLLRSSAKTTQSIVVVTAIKNYFSTAVEEDFLQEASIHEQTLEDQALKLVYEARPAKDSSVFKNISGIMIEKVTATWQQAGNEESMDMIRFVYKAPPEQKEDKPQDTPQDKSEAKK